MIEYVDGDDGLPTDTMKIGDERRHVKLDSGTCYTIAGTNWMSFGDKVAEKAPVDYVEGIGGFLPDVVGCPDEFLIGVDFMKERSAVMDFRSNEVRYSYNGRAVVIPFRTYERSGGVKIATVRMAQRTQLSESAVTPQVAVTAEDGERGMFVPTKQVGAVMLATTVTEVRNGMAWVPALNSSPGEVGLPSKHELGTWIPLDRDMEVLKMNESDQRLIKQLLRMCRRVVADTEDCPPATTLDVEHHIDTGNSTPIMMKRRRMTQTENVVVEDSV
ncbi:hypothetical protein PHMEG_00019093 [Phytophthora megakarya]|uniref:Uncharacterized protein n=1 Tax=Phytophthora megakarya TaxID=4795 RepID=A0A225VTY2_9STRA|nr:hypothetical protein PHMEG_00019093 [Phytophthora megakarya]